MLHIGFKKMEVGGRGVGGEGLTLPAALLSAVTSNGKQVNSHLNSGALCLQAGLSSL